MLNSSKKFIKDLPYQSIGTFKNIDPTSALLFFADPRSGSTWLAETFNQIKNTLIIDEPFHLGNSKSIKNLKFGWRQFIPEDAEWPAFKKSFNTILKGNLLNSGLCYRNSIIDAFKAEQLILKIIRGKGLLPWLVSNFNFKYKPIVVVRHPFAMVSSMMEHGGWNYNFQEFSIPNTPFNEPYIHHHKFLKTLKSKEEQLVALWCMSNNNILKHTKNNTSWLSFNYEDLVQKPEKNFNTIFEQWKIDIPEHFYSNLRKPSSTTIGEKTISPIDQVNSWKSKLTYEQIHKFQEILIYFEVDYYSSESMPTIPASQAHLTNK